MFAVGGVAIGLIVASVSTRLVASWLYGVGATDPMTFAVVAVAMIGRGPRRELGTGLPRLAH